MNNLYNYIVIMMTHQFFCINEMHDKMNIYCFLGRQTKGKTRTLHCIP